MQQHLSTAIPAAASDPGTPARAPRRLPDELVLMILDWCRHLKYKRESTLAALCRLSKRYHKDGERLLYTHVELLRDGSVLKPLTVRPWLRRHVKSVYVGIEGQDLEDARVASVLANLHNVEVVCGQPSEEAIRLILSHPRVRLASLELDLDSMSAPKIFMDCAKALSSLRELRTDVVSDLIELPAAALRHLKTLYIETYCDGLMFDRDMAPSLGQLDDLTWPVLSDSEIDLAPFPHLERLQLRIVSVPHAVGRDAFERRAGKGLVQLLEKAGSRTRLIHLAVQGTVQVRLLDDRLSTNPAHFFGQSSTILAALPRHIQYLTLDTNCVRPTDFAAYLLDPARRPPGLRRLQVGNEVGLGLMALLRGVGGPYGALAGELERAGIEVTMTASSR
ncbi:hypothetical protein JCM8208_000953 [Rhodotorula glutinis]